MAESEHVIHRELGKHDAKLEELARELEAVNRRLELERLERRQTAATARLELHTALKRAYEAQKAYERAMFGRVKLGLKVAFWTAVITAALVGLLALADPTGFKLIFRWMTGP